MKTKLYYTSTSTVTAENTAIALGSGDMEVLATPALVALMENAAMEAVIEELDDEQTTVGAHIDVAHLRPTPIGETVHATAVLTAVEGRKLTFSVKAEDGHGVIGEGTHVRYIVDRHRFLVTPHRSQRSHKMHAIEIKRMDCTCGRGKRQPLPFPHFPPGLRSQPHHPPTTSKIKDTTAETFNRLPATHKASTTHSLRLPELSQTQGVSCLPQR